MQHCGLDCEKVKQLPRNEKPERNVVYSKIGRRKEVTTVRNLKTELKRYEGEGIGLGQVQYRTEQNRRKDQVSEKPN